MCRERSDDDSAQTEALPSDCIRVENKIYSAEKLAQLHPGGPLFIKAFSGRDASQAFLTYHRRQFPHTSTTAKHAFQREDQNVKHSAEDDHEDFIELCRRVDKVLPRAKSFAPPLYYLKVLVLLSSAVGLELYMHYNAEYKWYLAATLGFFFALIGLNIQHDANHGAISRRPWVNRALGASQNWIGGSAIAWIHQHVVQHHIHTNDVHLDPDISGSAYLRLNPLKPLLHYHVVQHVYFFLLLALYGFLVVGQSLADVLHGFHFTSMSPLLTAHTPFEVATSVFFLVRWLVVPFVACGFSVTAYLSAMANVAPMFMVGGYYLAFFFSISHNFVGVHMQEDTSRESNAKKSFLHKQVVSSSNVGGWWLCQLNGGLNYQIEHHLFPRISHAHYPTIAPVVRQFCKERGVPYVHFDTVTENVSSCAKHLADLGSQEFPKGMVLAG